LSKRGEKFGDLFAVRIGGIGKVDYVPFGGKGNFATHWGRRGPSGNIWHHIPKGTKDIDYFYSELRVPKGQDVIGSYFVANGFNVGYFGMQVNSETERRILFSVWSPYKTDDPSEIPENERVKLLRKGDGVTHNDFGNEGSGGQSYWKYMWKTETTYGFLLKGEPSTEKPGHTIYTAWFHTPDDTWHLIASWSRPKSLPSLKGFYSFAENFRE